MNEATTNGVIELIVVLNWRARVNNSGAAATEATAEERMTPTKMLVIGGITTLIAWGRIIKRMVCKKFKPVDWAASI